MEKNHLINIKDKINNEKNGRKNIKLLVKKSYEKLLFFFEKSVIKIDQFINFIFSAKNNKHEIDEVILESKSPIIFGSWVMIITFGLGGVWALFAPLNSASIAEGMIMVASKTKNIQHLEGGIIERIFIKEGDQVKKDDPLIKLSETRTKSSYSSLDHQISTLQAAEDRIMAERDDLDEIEFDQSLLRRANELEIGKILDTQKRLFNTRKEAMANKLQIYEHKIEQLNNEVLSINIQLESTKKQLKIVEEQTNTAEELNKKGNLKRTILLELQKNLANIRGMAADYQTKISSAKQRISGARVEMLDAKTEKINNIMRELKETQFQLSDAREKFKSSEDQLSRVLIRSPQDGIIKNLLFNTVGGVIRSGEIIAEIVPLADRLIVEAKVKIQDIDRITIGQKAKIKVAAYKSRIIPMLRGVVTHISPDSFEDPRGMRPPYYSAKIEIDTKQYLKNSKLKDLHLYPGMRADILIITGNRSFAKYLIDPFLDTIRKSFKER